MTDANDSLAIPDWPDVARQFASKCGPVIDRLLKDGQRFDPHFNFSDARGLTLTQAARARAVREVEVVIERRATATSVARKFGVLFEELCGLAGPDGAAKIFETVAECARLHDFGRRAARGSRSRAKIEVLPPTLLRCKGSP
jgi:hypothetical protein